ncbi:SDR family oxidoreductase [Frankia sp. AgB1.9]|uniref:SDR family oxidoreductase n=1 Tax=unclassified Frankia TaxID=2632575 RepID=UPI00193311ED|nr:MULTISPECIES: SDR family NAD(P)-dependent oxidoreductase [unclassified Frankia]MBL7486823.1 SDR family oxidoreductase [Frankia sp. AgW1.1]MBL7549804.1 SDR family oxidoreductase [Frankia sp. AgB1.9]MBL7622886.1 SDR family oxidoreductase [Frankia sp. AgB1.8]
MATRTAIVTGGSGGIGRACGLVLQERGYDVVLTARRAEPLAEAAREIGCRFVAADCAEPDEFARVVAACEQVDLLVHSAGVLRGTFVRKERIEQFDAVIRANLRSTFVAVQGVLPIMPVRGRIVLISSSAGDQGMKGRSAYSASKGAVNAFADALRGEVVRDGIHVNVIVPAPVETAMLAGVTFEMHAIQASDVAAAVGYLDGLDPRVVVPRIDLRAVESGPLAPAPLRPPGAAATAGARP